MWNHFKCFKTIKSVDQIPSGSKIKQVCHISLYVQTIWNLQWRKLNQCQAVKFHLHVPLRSPFLWAVPLIDTFMGKMSVQLILPSNCLPLLAQCSSLTVILRDTVTLRVNKPWETGFPILLTKQVQVDHLWDERSKVRSWSFQPLYSCNK